MMKLYSLISTDIINRYVIYSPYQCYFSPSSSIKRYWNERTNILSTSPQTHHYHILISYKNKFLDHSDHLDRLTRTNKELYPFCSYFSQKRLLCIRRDDISTKTKNKTTIYRYFIRRCYHTSGITHDSSTSKINENNTFSIRLPYRERKYNSVEIDVDSLELDDSSEFGVRLWITISELQALQKSCIYINVSIAYSHFISVAGNYGFKFHHAEGEIACLILWLASTPNRVPPFATHHCGVGGLIVNSKNEILVVKEHDKVVDWKLPGGYVNLGEEFGDAIMREVWEETKVKTRFQELLTIRHSHNIQFGRSDIYVICLLEPLTTDIRIDDEIDDAKWINMIEFRKQVKQTMLQIALDMVIMKLSGLKEGTYASVIPGRKPFKLYAPEFVLPK